jgi:hypothetical protein
MEDICPNPLVWNRIYVRLKKRWLERGKLGEQPPKPLVVDLWAGSTDTEKARRWQETVKWARENNCLAEIRNVPAQDMYRVATAV